VEIQWDSEARWWIIFGDDDKWGIDMLDADQPALIMAANLKRIARDQAAVNE
jgi:hypothetical protein